MKNRVENGLKAGNPNAVIKDMILSIEALKGLYRMENDALDNYDIQSFLGLQDKKMSIAKDYQEKHGIMMSYKDQNEEVDADLKDELNSLREEFAKITQTNVKRLTRIKKVTERLYGRVMGVAKEEMLKRQSTYGASGSLRKRDNRISVGMHESA